MRLFNKSTFKAIKMKHGSEILIGIGIVGTVATTVMACKATTKLEDILKEGKERRDLIHECQNDESLKDEYSEEDAKKDLLIVYTQTAIKVTKIYAPSIILGAFSIGCILASHNMLKERNLALVAAYSTLDKGYKNYRKRVVEKFGENVDRELKHNLKVETFEDETVDEETGKKKKEKNKKEVMKADELSIDSLIFDNRCKEWDKIKDYNEMFLNAQQNYANDLLRVRGHLFLNEIYDALGAPRTTEGQLVGWYYDPNDETKQNHIDFDIKSILIDYEDGNIEESFVLDFNIDGVIVELI